MNQQPNANGYPYGQYNPTQPQQGYQTVPPQQSPAQSYQQVRPFGQQNQPYQQPVEQQPYGQPPVYTSNPQVYQPSNGFELNQQRIPSQMQQSINQPYGQPQNGGYYQQPPQQQQPYWQQSANYVPVQQQDAAHHSNRIDMPGYDTNPQRSAVPYPQPPETKQTTNKIAPFFQHIWTIIQERHLLFPLLAALAGLIYALYATISFWHVPQVLPHLLVTWTVVVFNGVICALKVTPLLMLATAVGYLISIVLFLNRFYLLLPAVFLCVIFLVFPPEQK